MAVLLDSGRRWRTHFLKGTPQGSFQQRLVEIVSVVSEEKIFFKISSPFFNFQLDGHLGWKVRITGHNFGRGPYNGYFIKIWIQLSNWFQTRRLLCEFPIGSYVKLSSAVAAILVSVLKCRTKFWKRTTQEPFQQSLVKIGLVVLEKIFVKFHPPFFLICIIGQNRQKFKVHKKSSNLC